jgi:hypothetical protein
MTQHIQQPAQRSDWAAARARAATLARRQVLLQRRQQEAVATAVTGCWMLGLGCWSTWGAEFSSDDPPRRYHASLQAPPVAVLLTLIRACDRITVMEVDLGDGFAEHLAIGSPMS